MNRPPVVDRLSALLRRAARQQRLTAVLLYAPLALIAIGWANGVQGRDSILALNETVSGSALPGAVFGLITGLVLAQGAAWCGARFGWARALEDEFAAALGPLRRGDVFWLALWSALGEEFLFRGAMQPAWGWLASTLLFALCHVPLRRSLWPWTVMALAAGAVLGGLFELLGTLWAPLVAHFVVNLRGCERLRTRPVSRRPVAAGAAVGDGVADGRYRYFGDDEQL
ncbi:MAG TPA: CPBP family intramembrane metalloprotease [bacterium]|nr:CPBP family intramembrane metalloprotease [bacterium]